MPKEDMFQGLFFKTPHDNAPDFVKRKISIKVDDFIAWLQENQNSDGWVNADLKEAKSGHWYAEINRWTPDSDQSSNNSSNNSSDNPSPSDKTWGSDNSSDKPSKQPAFKGFRPGNSEPEDFEDEIPF